VSVFAIIILSIIGGLFKVRGAPSHSPHPTLPDPTRDFTYKMRYLQGPLLTAGPGLQANHHSMTGSTKDPKDGKAVAGSVFAAVVVYAVRPPLGIHPTSLQE